MQTYAKPILEEAKIFLLLKDQWKQEVHDQNLVGKRADLAMFGGSVALAVLGLALKGTLF